MSGPGRFVGVWGVLLSLAVACGLNPQPEPPAAPEFENSGAGGAGGVAGASTDGSNDQNAMGSGASPTTAPPPTGTSSGHPPTGIPECTGCGEPPDGGGDPDGGTRQRADGAVDAAVGDANAVGAELQEEGE